MGRASCLGPASSGAPRLRGKSASRAKAAGQSLEATVHIGRGGLTDGNAAEVARQLKGRGLVKVKIARDVADASTRRHLAEELASRAGGDLVEVRGLTALLARRRKGRGA